MSRKLLSAAFALSSLLPAVSVADTTMIYKEGAGQNMLRVAGGRVRFDNHQDGSYMLFNAARREMTMVEPAKREFSVMDEATLDALQSSLDGMASQIEAQMAGLPPEMRAQMRQMMGGVLPDPEAQKTVRIEATGRKGEAAGFKCEYSRVLINNAVRSEACLAPADRLDFPAADAQAVRDWLGFARMMAEKASRYVDIDAAVFGDGSQVPLIYHDVDSQTQGILKEVSHAAVDPGLMDVPAGFRERKLELPAL